MEHAHNLKKKIIHWIVCNLNLTMHPAFPVPKYGNCKQKVPSKKPVEMKMSQWHLKFSFPTIFVILMLS